MKHAERITSRDYAHPYRPSLVALANRAGRALERYGRNAPLSVDDLIARARAKTKLARFADESFREPLGVLVLSLESEARLTPVGRALTRVRLVDALANRLRADALIAAEPAIVAAPLAAPLFVTGLQRTGTTLLHRLLSSDPGARALASWEALNPAPVPPRWGIREPRILEARAAEAVLRYLAPDFFAVHPIEAESPEEEVVLIDHSFLSTVGEASYRVPSYASWLAEQDQTPAYRYLERMLQLLSWQRPARRWVLKTPHHLEWLDTLFAVFPEARVVWTHRDPLHTVPSFCSMVAHGRGVFSDHVDPHEVGRHWLAKIATMTERALASRQRLGEERFLDVRYDDLMRDPLGEVARVYRWLDLPLGEEALARMRAWLAENRQHKYGRHRYGLEDFGLSEEEVTGRLAAYRSYFGY